MLSLNNKISIRQLQALLILDCFGTGIITLPRVVAMHSNQDGWISVIIGTVFACLSVFFICSISERFSDQSFVSYSSKILSKPIAIIISIVFVIKILVMISMELRFFGEVVEQTLLPSTPFNVVAICMVLVSAIAAAKGYEVRARMAEALIPIVILPLLLVFLIAIFDTDFTNIMPISSAAPSELIKGAKNAVLAFANVQFLLLAYPYLQRPTNAKHNMIHAVMFIGIIFTFITLITIAQFGAADVQKQVWPVIEMMVLIEFPGSFIERQDALMMSFWIISIFAIVNAGLFFASMLLKDIFNKGKQSTYIIILIPVVFLLSLVPDRIQQIYNYKLYFEKYSSILFMFVIPIILFVVARVRKI